MPRRVPMRAQVQLADCGAACLAAALEYHGKRVPLEEVVDVAGAGRDGTDALRLVEAARYFGVDARGVRVEIDDLAALPTGTLLFWAMSHFVVLDRVRRRGVDLVDPAVGRLRATWPEVGRLFTGVAILLEPGAGFVRGGRRPGGVWRHLRPLVERRWVMGRVAVISLLLRVLGLGLPLLTAVLVDRVVPTSDRALLGTLAVALAAMVAFSYVSSWLRSRLLLELRTRVDQVTTIGFLEHLVALPYTFHLRRSAGDLMMRLRSNSSVREILTTTALSGLLDGVFALLYLVVLVAASPQLALLVVGLGALQVTVLVVSWRASQRLAREGLAVQARSQSYAFQLLAGMGTLKASGTEHRSVEQFSRLLDDELAVTVARGRLSAVVDSATGALRLASPLVLLTVAGLLVLDGSLALGTALAVNALAVGFLEPLSALVTTAVSLQLLRSYLERLDDVFETPVEQPGEVRPAPVLAGRIAARDVSFRYAPLAPLVVRGITLEVASGSTIAIVGRSGSGKTTLANVLVGLFRPTDGVVLYDGLDLATLDVRGVRRQLGVVTQEPYLFGVSIRDNIAFSDPSLTLDAVRDAARRACVAEDIEAMPMGYDTVLGDAGTTLSGGQRQRVALARALASNPRVLLLDEATSHLDALTEAAVFAELARLDCTTIVVAHRISTVAGADLIVVMDDGRIVEQGRHAELLAARGHYHALVTGQLRVAAPEAAPAP